MRARSMPKRREALRADAVQSPLGKIKQFASDTPPAPAAVWSLRKKAGYFLAGKQNLPIFAPHYGNAVHPHFLSLFHGVMVSTRVFGSLSPRSSRSGTTIPSPPGASLFLFFFLRGSLFFQRETAPPHPGLTHFFFNGLKCLVYKFFMPFVCLALLKILFLR